jgi:hypothetical protein
MGIAPLRYLVHRLERDRALSGWRWARARRPK